MVRLGKSVPRPSGCNSGGFFPRQQAPTGPVPRRRGEATGSVTWRRPTRSFLCCLGACAGFSQHSRSLQLFQVITCLSIGCSNGLQRKKSQLILIFAMQVAEKLPCPYGDSLESGHVQAPQFLRHGTLRQQQN